MVNLEKVIFHNVYAYNPKLINKCIAIVKSGSRNEQCCRSYKWFIFMMMNKIVRKNIFNFISLIRGFKEQPDIEIDNMELVSECYVVFETCLKNYDLTKSKSNNFYFFFNTALSRKFYKDYSNHKKHTPVEMSEGIAIKNPNLRTDNGYESIDFLISTMKFSEIEIRIINSRINGQSKDDFLEDNIDIDAKIYTACLKNVKTILYNYTKNEE